MKRKYTVEDFLALIEHLRRGVPDIYLLTDIICGYPTETEEDWQMTLDLVKRCNFQGAAWIKGFGGVWSHLSCLKLRNRRNSRSWFL